MLIISGSSETTQMQAERLNTLQEKVFALMTEKSVWIREKSRLEEAAQLASMEIQSLRRQL